MIRQPARTQPHLQEPPPNAGASSDASGTVEGPGLVYQAPVVTYILIAANFLMWIIATALAPHSWLVTSDEAGNTVLLLLGAKVVTLMQQGQWWRLVTAMFLHGGLIHLAVNMWALLQLGSLCEIAYGRTRFLIFYVCAGVLGNVASYEISPELGVGASGAVWGLFGVAIVFSLKSRRDLPGQVGDRLFRSLVPVLLFNLVLTLAIPIIDKSAHLGGFLAGLLLAALSESKAAPASRRAHELLPVPAALATSIGLLCYGAWGLGSVLPVAGAYFQANLAVQRRRTDQAVRILERSVARHPDPPILQLPLLDLLLEQRRWQEATDQYLLLTRSSLPALEKLQAGMVIEQALGRAGQRSLLESVFARLFELHPTDPQLVNGICYPYIDVGGARLAEAERLMEKAVEAEPNDGNMVDTLAWIYYKQDKLKQAYTTQQRAIRLNSQQADLRYHMGAIEEAMGHLPAAREEYEMALRLDPKQVEAQKALTRLQSRPTAAPNGTAPAPSRSP